MDEKKICFIMCVNDWQYANEAMYYISQLNVPEGYTIDCLSVEEAKSMTAGYNEGMEASDAKYKVYLHQDVFIVDRDFLYHILECFQDESVGMIGMAGSLKMPSNMIMWNSPRIGWIYNANAYGIKDWKLGDVEGKYTEVEAIDGLLMVTQYDVPWREDIFRKWDFYDVSQSFEMRKAGYKVVVPYMKAPWCLHDDGFMNLKNYYDERDIFVENYMDSEEGLASEDMPSVTFIVITNGDDIETATCVDSIRENAGVDNYEIVVVDMKKKPGGVFSDYRDIVYINNPNGMELSCELGVKASSPNNDLMFLNANTTLTFNAVPNLRNALYSDEKYGMAGAVLNQDVNGQIIDEVFDSKDEYLDYARIVNSEKKDNVEYKVWLDFTAVMVKRSVYEEVSGFDNEYIGGFLQDYDFSMKVLEAGYQNILCNNSFIYTEGMRKYEIADKKYSWKDIYRKGNALFKNKWGVMPNYYSCVRTDLLQYIDKYSSESINVLEIGCGTGSTLGKIKYLYPNANVHGVEIVEQVAKLGAKYFDIICADVESMELPYEKNYFDYVIFGDVLEHLIYPEQVLTKIRQYMKPGGCVLASIPNLMNAKVIYELLKGDFTYESSGIRDKTHLRFFTYKEILRMFDGCGYETLDVRVSHAVGTMTSDFGDFFDKLLSIDGVEKRQFFDAFQYLVCARLRS